MTRRSFAGGAQSTTVAAAITSIATNGQVGSTNGWPDGTNGPFAVAFNRGQATEEKVLVTSRVGTTLTFTTRGYDGTTPQSHSPGEPVELVLTSVDLDEANAHVNATTGVHGLVAGQKIVGDITTQTLIGKTMDGGSNVFTNIAQSSIVGLVVQLAAMVADTATRLTKTVADTLYFPLSGGTVLGTLLATSLASSSTVVAQGNITSFAGVITGPTITATGAITAANLGVTGAISTVDMNATGSVTGVAGQFVSVQTTGDANIAGKITVIGAATVGSVISTGAVTVGGSPAMVVKTPNAYTIGPGNSGYIGSTVTTVISLIATIDVTSTIKVEFSWYGLDPSVSGERYDISIWAAGIQYAAVGVVTSTTSAGQQGGMCTAILPAGTVSGSVTFLGRLARIGGSGNARFLGGPTAPLLISVTQF